VKIGDLVYFGLGTRGIIVDVYKHNGTALVTDFRGYTWTVRQNETEIISEAQ
tara:strand:+ start:443 stop:598 length:156 start_codon:yes stop_codon:yes gene_type:complete